eukprot:3941807-Rhodomonas_salina.2
MRLPVLTERKSARTKLVVLSSYAHRLSSTNSLVRSSYQDASDYGRGTTSTWYQRCSPRYTIPSTKIPHGTSFLRVSYAMPGTDTLLGTNVQYTTACYAMSGTELAHGASC